MTTHFDSWVPSAIIQRKYKILVLPYEPEFFTLVTSLIFVDESDDVP